MKSLPKGWWEGLFNPSRDQARMRQDLYRRLRNLRLSSQRLIEGLFPGSYRTAFRGPGLEFAEVREYDFGDDSRFIDWNVTSRLNSSFSSGAYTKVFREEREVNLMLVVDLSLSMGRGLGPVSKREQLTIVFAHLVYAAQSQNDRVGAVFFGPRVLEALRPRRGSHHLSRLIRHCLELEADRPGSDLAGALLTAHGFVKRRSILIILSDFRSVGWWGALSRVSDRHDVIACRIHDPLDQTFPETGFAEVVDPETRQLIPTWGANSSFQKDHRDYNSLQRLIWLRECHKRGVRTLEIGTHQDAGLELLRFFHRGGGR